MKATLRLGPIICVVLLARVLAGCGGSPAARPDGHPSADGGDGGLGSDAHGETTSGADGPGMDVPGVEVAGDDGPAVDGPADRASDDGLGTDTPGDVSTDAGGEGGATDGGTGPDGSGGSGPCGVLGWGVNTVAAIAPGGANFGLATVDGHLEARTWSGASPLGINNGWFGASSVAYSSDGALFGASTDEGFKLWRVADGVLLSSIPALANGGAAAVSRDGSVIAIRAPGQLLIWRAAGVLTITLSPIAGVAVSPDGTLVAAAYSQPSGSGAFPHAYYNGVWRVSDGQPLWSSTSGMGTLDTSAHAAFSKDGTLVAFGRGDRDAMSVGRVMLAVDGTLVSTIQSEIYGFSEDGLAVVGDPQISSGYMLFRVADGAIARTFALPSGSKILTTAFGAGTTALAIARPATGDDLQLFTDGVQTGVVSRASWQNNVDSVAISPDGTLVVGGSDDGTTRLWNATSSTFVANLGGSPLLKQIAAFSPDSARVARCTTNSTVAVVDVKQGASVVSPTPAFTIPVQAASVVYSPDGTLIGTGNVDHTASLWSAVDGSAVRMLWNLSGHTGQVNGIAFSPDGTKVATASSDRTIKIWNVSDGADLRTLNAGSLGADAVAFSPDGSWVIGSTSGAITIWDVNSGAVVGSRSGGSSNAVVTPSGSLLFVGDGGGIGRFHLPDFGSLGPIMRSTTSGAARALAMTPNGSLLASTAYGSAVIRLWCSP